MLCNEDSEYFFNISSDKCTSLKDLVKLYIYNPEQNISTLYIIMKNKHTVRKHFYTKTRFYTFHNLYRNFCDFIHYCNCVWDFFITEKSIIYALIKYNKFGSTFKKKLYTTNKTDIISTNSFPIIEKKN